MGLMLLLGTIGLALMGTVAAINTTVASWIGGIVPPVLGKAGMIFTKDRDKSP